MAERSYTVAEIDQMRDLTGQIVCGFVSGWGDVEKRIECRLRTYMLGGITPAALQAHLDNLKSQRALEK